MARLVFILLAFAVLGALVPVWGEEETEEDWIVNSPPSKTANPTPRPAFEESEEDFDLPPPPSETKVPADTHATTDTGAETEAETETGTETETGSKADETQEGAESSETPIRVEIPPGPKVEPRGVRLEKENIFYRYSLEALFVLCLGVYIFNYVRGTRQNNTIANAWSATCLPLMAEQFSTLNTPEAKTLIAESASDFVLYGTGRRHVKRMQCWLRLARRFDLISVLQRRVTAADSLNIFVDFFPAAFPHFVCAVVPQRTEKKFLADNEHVAALAKSYRGTKFGLPSGLTVLTDCPDLAEHVLSDEIAAVLDKYSHCVESLLLTDQYPPETEGEDPTDFPPRRRVLLLNLSLPEEHLVSGKLQALACKMAFKLIDLIAESRLPPEYMERAIGARREYAEKARKTHEKQMQRAQERRMERLKEEEQAARRQGPVALARWEEQQRKKTLKARQRSMAVRM